MYFTKNEPKRCNGNFWLKYRWDFLWEKDKILAKFSVCENFILNQHLQWVDSEADGSVVEKDKVNTSTPKFHSDRKPIYQGEYLVHNDELSSALKKITATNARTNKHVRYSTR